MTTPRPRPHLHRYVVLGLWALWFGGFTAYALIVVPVGSDVLGGHRPQGFVTQRVTVWFNLMAALVLAAFVPRWWSFVRMRRPRTAIAALPIAAVALLALFALHAWVGSFLDIAHRDIPDYDGFYLAHRIYLFTAAAHWLAMLVFVKAWLDEWSAEDQSSMIAARAAATAASACSKPAP